MRNEAHLLRDGITLIETAIQQITLGWPQYKLEPGHFSENQYRRLYHQGRISDADIQSALAVISELANDTAIFNTSKPFVKRSEVYRCALLYDFSSLPMSTLHWQIEEKQALLKLQNDVPTDVRERWLAEGADEGLQLTALWQVIENTLGLSNKGVHCEALLDLSPEQAEGWLEESGLSKITHEQTQKQARIRLQALIDKVGTTNTLSDCVRALSGVNSLDMVASQFQRIFTSGLNEWQVDRRFSSTETPSFYTRWRATVKYDANSFLLEVPNWQNILNNLPDNPLQAIAYQLTGLGIAQQDWAGYLQCFVLQMMAESEQMAQHIINVHPNALADYLAIRLTLDRGALNQICREVWKLEANLDALKSYFSKNLSEFLVRQYLYQGNLPEYLVRKAEVLIIRSGSERSNREDWQALADLIQTWQISPAGQCQTGISQGNSAWRLFRLCQHLGLSPNTVTQFQHAELMGLLSVLDKFDSKKRERVWLTAFENHYRNDLFQVLQANQKRRSVFKASQHKEAQFIFCMDEREESLRRAIESLNPALETYGALGYFGLAMNFTSLEATHLTPAFPKTLEPAFSVKEVIRAGEEKKWSRYQNRFRFKQIWIGRYQQSLSGNPLLAQILINLFAPFAWLDLLGKTFYPKIHHQLLAKWWGNIFSLPKTQLQFFALNQDVNSNGQSITIELADLVADFLTAIGLTQGFAPMIVVIGHTAENHNSDFGLQNNCEFCRGYSSGVNARAFAALANQPEIRNLLKHKGIDIPADTWFMGAEHNTRSEAIVAYDLQDLPASKQQLWQNLSHVFSKAAQHSAHERCRQLTGIPKKFTLKDALTHVQRDVQDFSLPHPELQRRSPEGVIIGRRICTQGIFLDRNVALLSYDTSSDRAGIGLEMLLQRLLPIFECNDLKCYFHATKKSTNDEITLNSTSTEHWFDAKGLIGDFDFHLPEQMTKFYGAKRLQLIIEAPYVLLEQIIARHTDLQSLISGEWIQLSALDPDTGQLFSCGAELCFKPFQADDKEKVLFDNAIENDSRQKPVLPPFLIKPPVTECRV